MICHLYTQCTSDVSILKHLSLWIEKASNKHQKIVVLFSTPFPITLNFTATPLKAFMSFVQFVFA